MNVKKGMAMLLMLCLILDTFVCIPVLASQNPLHKVWVSDTLSLNAKKQKKIKIKNMPKKAKVSFQTKNRKIATVTKNGIVKGKKKGKVTILIRISYKKYKIKKKCKVTIREKKAETQQTEKKVFVEETPTASSSVISTAPSVVTVTPFRDGASAQTEVPNGEVLLQTETPDISGTSASLEIPASTETSDTIPDTSKTTNNSDVSETPSGNQELTQTETPINDGNQPSSGTENKTEDNMVQTEPGDENTNATVVEVKKEDTMYFSDDVTHGGLYVGNVLYLISKENIKKIANNQIKEFSMRTVNMKTLDMDTKKAAFKSENQILIETSEEEKIAVTISNTPEALLSLHAQSETIPIRFAAYNVSLTETKEEGTFYIGTDYYKVTYSNLIAIDNRTIKIMEYEKNGVKQEAVAKSGEIEVDGYTFYLDYDKDNKKLSLMIIDSEVL